MTDFTLRPVSSAPVLGKPSPWLVFLIISIFLLTFFVSSFLTYIPPYMFGIKEAKLGANRGIQPDVYDTGLHFVVPGMSRFHLLPKSLQVFDLTNHQEERSLSKRRFEKAAHIQTSDGFFVDVDVTILFRIADPYMVIKTLGPGELFIENGIIPRAEPVLKRALGALTTEEFYNSHMRAERVELAKKMLDEDVTQKGLRIEQILIRYFQYSPEIQKNIEERKLKDQLVFKNRSEKRAATAEAELKKVIQEGEAKLTVKLQEGEAYITTRRAEQELYSRKKHAEADLLVKLAEARKTELKNSALQGVGSEHMVGLKMAEILDNLQLIVLPSDGKDGVNPLDLNQTLKLFGFNSKQEAKQSNP